ncbi:MAG: RluA family pseudouridine synthase [Candidatus Eisenbacteria bacterium]|uniref:Pseudouridine synthase n=1 Tax=Eiseniibacteriota bacterium TaxID=2212470 RepID=A0A948S078_UNCEI|nr:RluA family pseudouridine synthase [Candidatus Eisenbacteria bacterium]MBU1948431.1 RluA family pseudouridine synthase [Candidatus Eisenbacteria bacterium]MBU2692908.1 RluA family pseudouridine synthase [Candidatus Eisenbacteria bacterium]
MTYENGSEKQKGKDQPRDSLVVPLDGEGCRLDRYLADQIPHLSREQVAKLIRQGAVEVGDQVGKSSLRLKMGQRITFPIHEKREETPLTPEPIPLQILFEDEDLLVIHKPPGMVVHPGAGVRKGTLVHGLLHHLPGWKGVGGLTRPGIVHRLDRGTSGLLVVAKSELGYQNLVEQIRERRMTRRYITLAWGSPPEAKGTISAPIGRDPKHRQRMAVLARGGKEAISDYELLRAFDILSLLRVSLRTGRTHQIRVHLASLGHPVFCDPTYGGGKGYARRLAPQDRPRILGWLKGLGRPALHAYHLTFHHPLDDEKMVFETPVPGDMERILLELETLEKEAGG